MREQYKRLFNIVSVTILLMIQTVIFSLLWYNYFVNIKSYTFAVFNRRGNWAVIGIYIIMMFLFAKTLGGYKVGYLKISDVCMSQFVAILCGNLIEYFELAVIFHLYINPTPLIILAVVEMVIVVIWAYISRRIYLNMYPPKNMIFVHGKRAQRELIDKINTRDDKFLISASISISEGLDVIYDRIQNFEAVIIGDIPSSVRNEIVKHCYANNMRAYITQKISDIIISGAEEMTLFDTPLLLSRNFGLSVDQLLVKRIMDILISVILLIILSPFMLITIVLIKWYDGGPIFYRQERLTRGRQQFNILKFRSMRVDSEKKGARLAMKDDDRITPVGRVIRRLHFDEIPQLINILKGDMAFVGPRPERDVIARQYEEDIPEFDFRLKVKAGLTGYAQVYGKYNTTPYDKLKLDLTYIEQYSVWLDIKIILMTVKTVFSKENTEGVNINQTTAATSESQYESEDMTIYGDCFKEQEK